MKQINGGKQMKSVWTFPAAGREEKKYQRVPGSVDEKLQTCDFKRKQYIKLVSELGLKVEYVYVLSEWFREKRYEDVLCYIKSVKCHYKFDELPVKWLSLPTRENQYQAGISS